MRLKQLKESIYNDSDKLIQYILDILKPLVPKNQLTVIDLSDMKYISEVMGGIENVDLSDEVISKIFTEVFGKQTWFNDNDEDPLIRAPDIGWRVGRFFVYPTGGIVLVLSVDEMRRKYPKGEWGR